MKNAIVKIRNILHEPERLFVSSFQRGHHCETNCRTVAENRMTVA